MRHSRSSDMTVCDINPTLALRLTFQDEMTYSGSPSCYLRLFTTCLDLWTSGYRPSVVLNRRLNIAIYKLYTWTA